MKILFFSLKLLFESSVNLLNKNYHFMNDTKLIISPKSRVLAVIEAYPELEEHIINYVPAFKNLKNPVLRRTIGKIATIQQAASIGNVSAGELVNHLRKIVGQDLISESESLEFITIRPAWFNEMLISQQLDITKMLAEGEQPVNQVMEDLKLLKSEKIYKLISPFITAPLIEKATSLEIKHWIDKRGEEEFYIYFMK